jgi:hypothetical protein
VARAVTQIWNFRDTVIHIQENDHFDAIYVGRNLFLSVIYYDTNKILTQKYRKMAAPLHLGAIAVKFVAKCIK